MMKKFVQAVALAAALSCAVIGSAVAQSSPNLTYGQVPTAAQWNSYFAGKQDTLGYLPLNTQGGAMLGRLVTAPPSASTAGFNLTPGSDPASPADGDLWVTSTGLFAQVNGSTIGPFSAASFAATSPLQVSTAGTLHTFSCPTCGVTGSPLSQFATTTSAQLGGVISDETGSGPLVFGTGPSIASPTITGSFTAPGLVTNAALAVMPAYTLKLNATSGTATPTDSTIASLPIKSSPVGADTIIIGDSSNGGALVQTTASALTSSAGGPYSTTAATISAFKALNPALAPNVYLTAVGPAGSFGFDSSDLSAAVAIDTHNGVYVPPNSDPTGASGAWVRQFDFQNYIDKWFGVVADGVTDNTAVLSTALATMTIPTQSHAATLHVSRNVKFYTAPIPGGAAGLNFASVANQTFAYVDYYGDSDLTPTTASSDGTSEHQLLSVNSGYPNQVNGGLVGENIFNAPLNPGLGTNIQANLNSTGSLTPYQNPLQTIVPTASNPKRSTFIMRDEKNPRYVSTYESYASNNALNAVFTHTFSHISSVAGGAGFTSTGWCGGSCVPVVGNVLVGVTSGAIGIIKAPPAGQIIDTYWVYGRFQPGEQVKVGANINTVPICGGCASENDISNTGIFQGLNNPVTTIDVSPGNASTAFTVGGRLTVTAGEHLGAVPENVTSPATMFCESSTSSNCLQILYDTTPAAANRRLYATRGKTQSSSKLGWIGAISAASELSSSGGTSSSGENIASIGHPATGQYSVTFLRPLTAATYFVVFGKTSYNDNPSFTSRTTTGFTINNTDLAGTVHDAIGLITFAVIGGDY